MTIAVFLPAESTSAPFAWRMGDALQRVRGDVRVIAVSDALQGDMPLPDDAVYLVAAEVLPLLVGLPRGRMTVMLSDVPGDVQDLLDVRRIIVPSEALQVHLTREYCVAADRIAVVAPGIDPYPRSAGSASSTCHILSVGDLIARKGHATLIEALGRLRDLDWRLCIVAEDLETPREPEYGAALHKLIEDRGLADRITFSMTPDWLPADLFALASDHEPYGCAIAEALRRGLPVAVTNVGAVPTLVGPEAGVVCAVGEIDQLSKSLRRLIFDAKLRGAMAEIAWESSQGLPSWRDQAALLADMIS
jgi:glycosyltransferase involved in cell wall biosynthesis